MANNGKFFELLAIQIATGRTVKAAAADCNCSERQAYRIASGDDFQLRVAKIRTEAATAIVGRLVGAGGAAVGCLENIVNDTDAKPGERVAAAKTILSLLVPLSEFTELRQRLDRLEKLQQTPLRVTG